LITRTSSLEKLVEDVQESFTGWVPQQIWSFQSQWSTLTFKQHEVCTNHRNFQTSLAFSIRRAGGRHIIQFSGEGDITVMEADVTDPTALVGAPGGKDGCEANLKLPRPSTVSRRIDPELLATLRTSFMPTCQRCRVLFAAWPVALVAARSLMHL